MFTLRQRQIMSEALSGKKYTKASAKAAVKKFAGNYPADKIEIDSDEVTIWWENDLALSRKGEALVKKLSRALGSAPVTLDGYKGRIHYKKAPEDKGDPADPTSRWHY